MECKLFLIAGHNGAGKTTFLKEFVKIERVKYINADEIAQKISVDRFSLLAIKAGKIALKKIKKFRDERRDFVVETTLSGKMWKTLIPDFKKNNYHITLFFVYLDTPIFYPLQREVRTDEKKYPCINLSKDRRNSHYIY